MYIHTETPLDLEYSFSHISMLTVPLSMPDAQLCQCNIRP